MKGENGDFMENVFTSEKKLGFGLMRLPLLNPNDGSSIDIELTKKMVDTFLEKGFTYFDTAWMYCGFKSENAAKEALVSRHPRESYTLATKLHAGFIKTLRTEIRFSTNREKKQALHILIIIFFMMSVLTIMRYTRSLTVLTGLLIRRNRDL